MRADQPLILFGGPLLSGVTETAMRLGWASACHWEIPQFPLEKPLRPMGHLGPATVRWHGRDLRVDLDHRGPLWTPCIWEDAEWFRMVDRDPEWLRVHRCKEQSLREAQGCYFVADSQSARREANGAALKRLRRGLQHVGRASESLAVVFALNKRDLADLGARLDSVEQMREDLKWPRCDWVETSARTGVGIDDALSALLALVER